MALPPFTVRAPTRPANPATGGHYVPVGGGQFRLIHAVGPGKWALGPPKAKATGGAVPGSSTAAKTAAAGANAGRWANPLYQPSQGLSGRPLYQATRALTNQKYDPLINQYQQQLNQNALQGAGAEKATAGYYNQLAQYAQQSAQNVPGVEQGLGTQLRQIGQDTQTAFDQYAGKVVSPALANLAAQGLGGGAPQQLAASIADAKLQAAQQSASNQAFAAKVGAAQSELAGKLPGIYATAGQQRLGQIAQASQLAAQPIQQKLATTRGEKANAFVTNLMSARAAERNYGIAQAGLGLKQAAITTGAQTAAANRQAANTRTTQTIAGENQRTQANIDARAIQGNLDRASRESIASQNRQAAATRAAARAAAKTGKPASPATQRAIWNQITGVQGRFRWLTNAIGSFPGATPASTRSQAWHALNTGRLYAPYKDRNGDQKWHWVNIPPVGDTGLLNAAYNSLGGGLSPGDVSYLHNMGFTIGGRMPIRTDVSRAAGNVGQTVAQGVGRLGFK